MNKIHKAICHSGFVIALIAVSVCCTKPMQESFPNRVSFVINPKSLKMELPVHFNDSVTANLIFDTGGTALELDSSFCIAHPAIMHSSPDAVFPTGTGWSKYSVPASIYYSAAMTFHVGETSLLFDRMNVYDWKGFTHMSCSDGLFHIPQNDTTHIWELNFEHGYIEIHSDSNFVMPENCQTFPLTRGSLSRVYVDLPLQVTFSDGDTLTLNHTYLIDTAMYWDVVLISGVPEFDFFNSRQDAVWVQEPYYTRRFIVGATLSNQVQLDSLRIHTADFPTSMPGQYLVGLNFLKRFNVYFDLKNKQLGLLPIKSFQRIFNPLSKRFHMSSNMNKQGKFIIDKIADYDENYCKKAGLKEGDEIIAVNGKDIKTCTTEEKKELLLQDTLMYDINRQGKRLKIKVIVDRSENFEL
ncbi:PDZ domain-containing protein [Parabacteroides chinchillae]|uniref:PDZ domain-containing protein n=1 Tax=Parabacteroides chinchillae TaxID=871327 RepID=A0A8G2BZ70_9BACT|nr:PDZ domain-containing protein [Parabacteroides chinchillae]SEG29806.1 hypothetical protein SAMN05444001_1361 [Parabacteroides chinchillae]